MKKICVIVAILLIIGIFCSYFYIRTNMTGGAVCFTAVVTSIDGDTVYADVVSDSSGSFFGSLPEHICFSLSECESPEPAVGDYVSGMYVREAAAVRAVYVDTEPGQR